MKISFPLFNGLKMTAEREFLNNAEFMDWVLGLLYWLISLCEWGTHISAQITNFFSLTPSEVLDFKRKWWEKSLTIGGNFHLCHLTIDLSVLLVPRWSVLKRATWPEIYPDLEPWKYHTVKVEKLGIANTIKSATNKSWFEVAIPWS